MFRRVSGVCVLCLTIAAGPAVATTVTGTLAYDGQPVSTVFPGHTESLVGAYDTAAAEWFYGTVDLVSGTYQIPDLEAGNWFVRIMVGPVDFGNRMNVYSGELTDYNWIAINNESQLTLDFALRVAYQITQPYRNDWPGSVVECPRGSMLPAEFTFAWDPVPRAVSYSVLVDHWSCDAKLETVVIDTEETTVQILQGNVTGEAHLSIIVKALSDEGFNLAQRPWLDYDVGSSEGTFTQLGGGGGGGRAIHPTSSVFVPQVARLPGVSPSFWTSDVVLTNPTAAAVTAKLLYTERNANGLTDYLEEEVQIPAGACRVLEDVVGDTFETSGAGWLEVSPLSLRVASRISTPGSDGGSYGQGFPALPADAAVSQAGPVTALGVGGVVRGSFRSNLVLTEVWGESATVKVTVLDREGMLLGSTNASLQPFSTTQLNDVVARVGGPTSLEEGQVRVEVVAGQGKVISVLSLVDQETGDPTTLVLEGQ